jgi:hypothetical protein
MGGTLRLTGCRRTRLLGRGISITRSPGETPARTRAQSRSDEHDWQAPGDVPSDTALKDLLSRLAANNPVPVTKRAAVDSWAEECGARVAARRVQVTRPNRPRRPLIGIALASALAIVGVASTAIAGVFPGVSFYAAAPAPIKVVAEFSSLPVGAPPGMDPGVLAEAARRVMTVTIGGRSRDLWVAPTSGGGFCTLWSGIGGGCDRLGTTPLSVTSVQGNSATTGGSVTPYVVGFVSSKYSAAVKIRLVSGVTLTPAITWVSKPIDAGFFAYDASSPSEVESVAAYNSDGDIVTQQSLAPGTTESVAPPPDALVADAKAALSVDTPTGAASIIEAPTRYDGACAWIEFEGKNVPFAPCQPAGYNWSDGFTTRFYPTLDAVLFAGTVGPRYRQVVVSYADGATSSITPVGSFFLFTIPASHLRPGHGVTSVEAIGLDGQPIDGTRFTVDSSQEGGCAGVMPVSAGVDCAAG